MLRFVLSYSSHQPTKSRSEQCPGSRTVGSERRIGDPEVELVLCECIIADVLNEIVVSSTWARADLNERFGLISSDDFASYEPFEITRSNALTMFPQLPR